MVSEQITIHLFSVASVLYISSLLSLLFGLPKLFFCVSALHPLCSWLEFTSRLSLHSPVDLDVFFYPSS